MNREKTKNQEKNDDNKKNDEAIVDAVIRAFIQSTYLGKIYQRFFFFSNNNFSKSAF